MKKFGHILSNLADNDEDDDNDDEDDGDDENDNSHDDDNDDHDHKNIYYDDYDDDDALLYQNNDEFHNIDECVPNQPTDAWTRPLIEMRGRV